MVVPTVHVSSLASAKAARSGLIAYTTGNGEEDPFAIWTIKPDGSGNRRILQADSRFPSGPSGPRWSRDGTKLLFFRRLNRDDGPAVGSLWYLTLATRQLARVPLPTGRGSIAGYDWAPNGRRLVVSLRRYYDDATLYTLRVDGTRLKKLRSGQNPSWSGDGRRILFTLMKRRTPWASTVNVVRPDGAGFRRLSAPSANDDWSPSFSPGGTRVLYFRPTLRIPEWRMVDVAGRNDRLVWTYPTQSRFSYWCPPQWTPNGKRLATVRTEELTPAGADGPLATAFVTFNLSGQDERTAFTFPWEAVGTYGGGGCPFSWQRAR
jgi:Tol biopolymer transport system component